MVRNLMSHAAPMIRKVWAFAAPTMVVGIVLVSQALGRMQTQHASKVAQSKPVIHARQASGGQSGFVAREEAAINRGLSRQGVGLRRDTLLFRSQSAVNQLLFRLTQVVPANMRQYRSVLSRSTQDLRNFYSLEGRIEFNKTNSGRVFSIFTPRIENEINSLQQFAATNPSAAQFILAAELRLMAQEQQYDAILARPPATPFVPNPPIP